METYMAIQLKQFTSATSANGRQNGSCLRTGLGMSIAQYGELFQGQIEDSSSEFRRCLISLPCAAMYSQVVFVPDNSRCLRVTPDYKDKARKAVEFTFAYLKAGNIGGLIAVESTVPEAKGCGSSTADCVAAAIAAADSTGNQLREEELGKIVVAAEVASDNFMFHHAVLFAHREGVVLEDYARCLPKLCVLGFDTAQDDHVNTLDFPPADYSWRQRQSFYALVGALRRAIRNNDVELLGRVATASACINQEFLPKPIFNEIKQIAGHAGALGVSVAHSGTVASILLDPSDPFLEVKVEQIQESLEGLGISDVLLFQT
jgi:uncharacterized protein involved in propanediol utilization